MARLARIRRHPIKSAGGEDLERVSLTAHRRLPGDREWAVLHSSGEKLLERKPDADWVPKSAFLNTAKSNALHAVRSGHSGDELTLTHPELGQIIANPSNDPSALADWLAPLWPTDRGAPTRLVRSPAGWTDEAKPFVSVLSLSSLAALERDMGQKLDIERWRANLWIDGWEPFAEREMIGATLSIGSVRLRVEEPVGRCTATSGNAAGETDCDMLETLRRLYGNTDFGVFATIVAGGDIAIGDEVLS